MTWCPGDPCEYWEPLKGRPELRSVDACEREAWTLLSWPAGASLDRATGELVAEGEPVRRPFLCGSWRCRRCALWRGAVDWTRCRDAVCARPWWLYIVLTFDPSAWASPWDAYREAGRCWNDHLRESLRSRVGRFGYLQTWEAHVNRWPHVNMLLCGDSLREWVEGSGVVEKDHLSPYSGRSRRCQFPRAWRRWLRDAAQRAGFGPVAWVEVIAPENPDALAGYLCKLARELTGAPGGAKGEQSPVDAPKGFRRIRASRGILPPTHKPTGNYTGALLPIRTATEPHPARRTGERPEFQPATWASVLDAMDAKAELAARAWAKRPDRPATPLEVNRLDLLTDAH